jgi:opacity protein-like surface antigen
LIKKENMKKVVLIILACCGIGFTMNAVALEDYVGFSLDAVKSSESGVNDSSAGITAMISARPNDYYGWEVQGGILGKTGRYSASGEADFSIAGFLPFGNSGINLYGKAGGVATYSSGSVYHSGLTYGAGVEYLRGKGAVRLGVQYFDTGKSPSLSTKLIGVTILVKLDK